MTVELPTVRSDESVTLAAASAPFLLHMCFDTKGVQYPVITLLLPLSLVFLARVFSLHFGASYLLLRKAEYLFAYCLF